MENISNKINIERENKQTIGDRIRGKTYEEIYGQEKARIKIQKYIKSRKGQSVSENTKLKIAKTLTGKKLSPESIRKRTETRRRLFLEGKLKTNKGFIFSEDSRKKLSKSLKGRIVTPETRKKMSIFCKGKSWKTRYGKDIAEKMRIGKVLHRSKQIMPFKDTTIEVKIQGFLKELYPDFYTHQYINQIYHAYQCDIFIPKLNLIIECFGDYWHANSDKYSFNELSEWQKDQQLEDELRTYELRNKGFNLLILWENNIKSMKLDDFRLILDKYMQNNKQIFMEIGRNIQ